MDLCGISLSSPAKSLSQLPHSAKAIQHSLAELCCIFSCTEKENSGKAPISIFKKEVQMKCQGTPQGPITCAVEELAL